MTELMPMSPAEFADWAENAVPEFARDKLASGQWSAAEAMELASRAYAELLPQGLSTPGHHLCTLRDAASLEGVGMLWYAVETQAGQRVAFVYDLRVRAEHQRRGHASNALALLERQVRTSGLHGIGLHVFGHNETARDLYLKLGFRATSILMFKPVGHGP